MAEREAERAVRVAAATAQARQAAMLRRLADAANSTRSAGFSIPIVDADPGADWPGNAWFLDDGGRLRSRGTDATMYDFYSGIRVPSLASAPAVSTGIDLYRNTGDDTVRVRRKDGTWGILALTNPQAGGGTDDTGGTSTRKPKQPDPAPKRHRQTWGSTWARTLCASHGVEDTGRDQHYGHFGGSAHGRRRVMIGFNDSAIRSALAGAADNMKFEIHALNVDSWMHSGVQIHWGAHNRSAAPGSFSSVRRNVFTDHWPEAGDGAYWRTAPDWFGRAFRDNDIKGLTIDQPDGSAWYGSVRGATVQIRVTYVK